MTKRFLFEISVYKNCKEAYVTQTHLKIQVIGMKSF